MDHGFARVAAVSLRVHLGDVEQNEQEIYAALRRLENQDVQLAVFPELCLTGYTLGDLVLHSLVQRRAKEALLRIAKQTKAMAVVVGLPLSVMGRLYNCAAVLQDGQVQGIVPKTYLAEGGEFYEARWFTSGQSCPASTVCLEKDLSCEDNGKPDILTPFSPNLLFTMGGFSFAVEICEDLWAPMPPSSHYAVAGADLIVNLSASNALVGKQEYRRQLLAQQSARLYAGYAYAGAGYGESTSDLVFDGYTAVYESGRPLAEGPCFTRNGSEAIADVDICRLRYQRQRNRSFFEGHRKKEESPWAAEISMKQASAPGLPLRRPLEPLAFVPSGPDAAARMAEIAQIQTMGLMTRLESIHCKALTIGVSGGLDSTLALLIAARTFDQLGYDRKGIHAITMPGMGTGSRTKTNADLLMEALDVSAQEIPIEKAVLQHFADIGQDSGAHDVTYENAQARERTQILMDMANKVGGIVLGTGDMSELALGFCTYNGDHMSMYNVNASVPKTLVKALVRYLAETDFDEKTRRVCADIVATPISPELLPTSAGELTQRTEEILGDYALHDFFLYHLLSSGSDPARLQFLAEQAFAGVYDREKIKAQLSTFLRKFFTQQFKRNCSPDGPKVGSIGLSPRGDLRMPGDMGAGVWKDAF